MQLSNFHVCITNWSISPRICSTCNVCPSRKQSKDLHVDTSTCQQRLHPQCVPNGRVIGWTFPHFQLEAHDVALTGSTCNEQECDQPPQTADTGEPRENNRTLEISESSQFVTAGLLPTVYRCDWWILHLHHGNGWQWQTQMRRNTSEITRPCCSLTPFLDSLVIKLPVAAFKVATRCQ